MSVPLDSLCLLIFTLVLLQLTSLTYQYKELTIESGELCSPVVKRKLKLSKSDKSALVVKQTRLDDHLIHWEKNFNCKFKVISAFNRGGIIAVIQNLNFRRNKETFECIDYIEFKNKNGSIKQRYCGKLNATLIMDPLYIDPSKPISYANAVIDETGELDIYIFVSLEPLARDEKMDIELVLTSYKDCLGPSEEHDLKPCGENFKNVCIDKHFFNDNYINCPYAGCVDENGCLDPKPVEFAKKSVGNKVLIGSISSLFIMFAIFVLCLYICRRHKVFCWSEDFANPSTTQETNQPPRMEMSDQTGARLAANPSTAIPTAPVDEDKDLPPSYDSLFPNSTPDR